METENDKYTSGLQPTQVAWVVKDIGKSKIFFQQMLGISNFSPTFTVSVKNYDATYYGQPSDAVSFLAMAYTGGTFIEIIQPISGKSIFKDYIDHNPSGGVQHITFSTPVANLNNVISEYESKGYSIVSSFDTPIAKIVFFDTREEIGVFTEIMGITKEGEKAVEEMKIALGQQ
ncbi:hypothetical protein FEDK69T_04060 [Flavobacterium enshiense DK69]|uniref:VOC domain-containing protein n=1 Tax=Flavobacterium enshiense DK69 TaxID=1107311 RepID=V6SDU2_9FLAO|nr:VOC family protein [Flavobacterium enshiense]ESU24853.1 hypothetical protein FEDK69T_04060 [Flavobacterium enshiense DK69]KGO96698.1 hypothetical protein Q767_03035 [Flavobacterium enshiense DK69]